MIDQVILVDEHDKQIGVQEKISAHEQALLHRAFSVFIVHCDEEGQWWTLLQQRQHSKYHCGGLWTNSCCSHPKPGENIQEAAKRRIFEELGLKIQQEKLEVVGSFIYKAAFSNGLTEYELDHVVLLNLPKTIELNPAFEEIAMTRWLRISDVLKEIQDKNLSYTPWFDEALKLALAQLGAEKEI